jgi:hypothetical protein
MSTGQAPAVVRISTYATGQLEDIRRPKTRLRQYRFNSGAVNDLQLFGQGTDGTCTHWVVIRRDTVAQVAGFVT